MFLHPFMPRHVPGCDHCGEPEDAHRTDLQEYEVDWQATVTGTERFIYGASEDEAREQFRTRSEGSIHYSIENYDVVLPLPDGQLQELLALRVRPAAG